MKEQDREISVSTTTSVYIFEYKALFLLTFHFTILNNTWTHLPHLPLTLWVPACTLGFPLITESHHYIQI